MAWLCWRRTAPACDATIAQGWLVGAGFWINGRHNRAVGFNADLEKYLEAGLAGWRVFRLGPDQITLERVERLVAVVRAIDFPLSFTATAAAPGPVLAGLRR